MRLHDFLDYHARERPELDFAILGDRRITYAEANVQANQLAHAFMEAGLQTGDRFAYLSKNSLKYCVVEDVLFTHLPRNATGKVLKRVLREPYWEGHGQRVAGVSLLGTKINPPQRGERRVAFVQEHETPGSNGQQVEDG
jgi:acyl-CoA synthetase (AMP-forming)/AMP-acid ligase II